MFQPRHARAVQPLGGGRVRRLDPVRRLLAVRGEPQCPVPLGEHAGQRQLVPLGQRVRGRRVLVGAGEVGQRAAGLHADEVPEHLVGDQPVPGRQGDELGADPVAPVGQALGHERFALARHDRGALVAFRAGLDHPAAITHLACLDVLPTLDMWAVMHGATATVGFHLYLMAQPPGLPEQLIAASADAFFGHFLDLWTADPHAIPAGVRAAYLDASRAAVPSIVADYRASAGIDVDHEQADRDAGRRLAMPVTVLQQDWGAALGFDAAALWRAWAPDLRHATVTSGHFMAEEAPADITKALRDLLTR
jgi:haloacetate dehalogenase